MEIKNSKNISNGLATAYQRGRKTLCEQFFDAKVRETTRRKIELVVIQCLTGGRIIKELVEASVAGLPEGSTFDPRKIFGIDPSSVYVVDDHVIANHTTNYAAAALIEQLGCKYLGFNYIGKGNGNLHDVAMRHIMDPMVYGESADSHGQEWSATMGTGCIPGGKDYIIDGLLKGYREITVFPSIGVRLSGTPSALGDIRNVFFSIADKISRLGIDTNKYCIEFFGPGWNNISLDQKRVLTNLTTDIDFKMCLGSDPYANFEPFEDASYDHLIEEDLGISSKKTLICVPSGKLDGINPVIGMEPLRVHNVRVESCSGAHKDDLLAFCEELKSLWLWKNPGDESLRCKVTITPAGPEGLQALIQSGWYERLLKLNVEIYPPGCGGCIGIMPIPANNTITFSTAARAHQKGRLGNDTAQGFTGGPVMAARVAFYGYIGDHEKYGTIPEDRLSQLLQLCESFQSNSDKHWRFNVPLVPGKCIVHEAVSSDTITAGSVGSERINFAKLKETAFQSLDQSMNKLMQTRDRMIGSILVTKSYCLGASSRQEASEIVYDSGLVILAVEAGAIQTDNAIKRGVPIGIISLDTYNELAKLNGQDTSIDLTAETVKVGNKFFTFKLKESAEKITNRDPMGDARRIIAKRLQS